MDGFDLCTSHQMMPSESQKLSISLKIICNPKPQVTIETSLKECTSYLRIVDVLQSFQIVPSQLAS